MKSAMVVFADRNLEVQVFPATEENLVYGHLLEQVSAPYTLAIEAEKISEESALKILAKVYAGAIIVGSPSEELVGLSEDQWADWLLGNPEEFEAVRVVAENPSDWMEMADGS